MLHDDAGSMLCVSPESYVDMILSCRNLHVLGAFALTFKLSDVQYLKALISMTQLHVCILQISSVNFNSSCISESLSQSKVIALPAICNRTLQVHWQMQADDVQTLRRIMSSCHHTKTIGM